MQENCNVSNFTDSICNITDSDQKFSKVDKLTKMLLFPPRNNMNNTIINLQTI